MFLESGFLKELRAALIPVEKPENFEAYVAVVRRVALDLERGHSKGHGSIDIRSYDTGIEWETASEARVASTSRTYAKRVSKDVIEARRSKGLCLRYSDPSYRIRECTFLPPARPGDRVYGARAVSSSGRSLRVSASRIRQIEEALSDLDSSDFHE